MEAATVAGDNYTFKMPTEELKTEMDQLKRKLLEVEAELDVARRERCPDLDCPNCRRHRNFEAWSGDVHWLYCPTCGARDGKPCRDQRGGRNRPHSSRLVLMRPHRGRPWAPHPPGRPL